MAYSDFNEDYRKRTSGLQAWMQSVAGTPQPQQPAGFGSLSPSDKAINLAQEAASPGSAEIHLSAPAPAPQETPFRDTFMGGLASYVIPGVHGMYEKQRGQEMANIPKLTDDPVQAIQRAMEIDPKNARGFLPLLLDAKQKEPAIKREQALQAWLKAELAKRSQQPTIGAPSPEFGTSIAPPPAEVDQGVPLVPDIIGAPSPMTPSALSIFDKYPAQTMAESAGNPNAVSPKGALGLKQIMPATGADPGFGIKPWDGTQEDNVRFGNDYFDAMKEKYNGNIPLALAAYNWGPGATDDWLAAGADPAKMPAETRDYIAKLAPQMSNSTTDVKLAQNNQTALAQYAQQGRQYTPEQQMALEMAAIDPRFADNFLASLKPGSEPTPYSDRAKVNADIRHGYLDPKDVPDTPALTEDQIKLENAVRQEFEGLGTVKEFRVVDSAFTRIRNSVKDPSAAGDVATVFNFMKMLDPGSTVREGEFATAQNSAGVPDIIRTQWNKLLNGERLADAQRKDFFKRAKMLHKGAQEGFNGTAERYQVLAKEYGMSPERISKMVKLNDDPSAPDAPATVEWQIVDGKLVPK